MGFYRTGERQGASTRGDRERGPMKQAKDADKRFDGDEVLIVGDEQYVPPKDPK